MTTGKTPDGSRKVSELLHSGLCTSGSQRFSANHSKTLNTIALSDADAETALAFVQQKLKEAKSDIQLTPKATASVERLGGRASDLDNVWLPILSMLRPILQLTHTVVDLQGSQWFNN